jgi:hypothetical protein
MLIQFLYFKCVCFNLLTVPSASVQIILPIPSKKKRKTKQTKKTPTTQQKRGIKQLEYYT